MDLRDLLKKKKQDAIVLKIEIEPKVEGEDLEEENEKEGIAPPLEDKKAGGDYTDGEVEKSVEELPMKEMFMDEADERRVGNMMMKKEKGLLGRTSLSDKAKMEMLKKK
jgi:hypothetical protein